MDSTYYEVIETDYNTFGDESTHVAARYLDEGAANMHAYLANQGWGTRARIEVVTPIELSDATPAQVMERYKYKLAKQLTRKEVVAIARGEVRR